MEVIRRYIGKLGEVTVTRYDDKQPQYQVKHTGLEISPAWYLDKTEAIKHAQFLAGKY